MQDLASCRKYLKNLIPKPERKDSVGFFVAKVTAILLILSLSFILFSSSAFADPVFEGGTVVITVKVGPSPDPPLPGFSKNDQVVAIKEELPGQYRRLYGRVEVTKIEYKDKNGVTQYTNQGSYVTGGSSLNITIDIGDVKEEKLSKDDTGLAYVMNPDNNGMERQFSLGNNINLGAFAGIFTDAIWGENFYTHQDDLKNRYYLDFAQTPSFEAGSKWVGWTGGLYTPPGSGSIEKVTWQIVPASTPQNLAFLGVKPCGPSGDPGDPGEPCEIPELPSNALMLLSALAGAVRFLLRKFAG